MILPSTQNSTSFWSHLTVRAWVQTVDVPVIGGHAGITILPLFSQATGFDAAKLSDDDIKALTVRTQDGGTEVVQARPRAMLMAACVGAHAIIPGVWLPRAPRPRTLCAGWGQVQARVVECVAQLLQSRATHVTCARASRK